MCLSVCGLNLYLCMFLWVLVSAFMNNSRRATLSAEASAPDRWNIHANLVGRGLMRGRRRPGGREEKSVKDWGKVHGRNCPTCSSNFGLKKRERVWHVVDGVVRRTCRRLGKQTDYKNDVLGKHTYPHTKARATIHLTTKRASRHFYGPTPLDLFIPLNQDGGSESDRPLVFICWRVDSHR